MHQCQRCTNASDAVRLVGSLIDTNGYYGTRETLLFADPKEAWVMEMCGGTLDNRSGLWVAQKVPDGDVFVASNSWWLNETGYQYGPRIYQYAQLQNLTGVIYVNETAYTQPGNELNYINESQRI